MTYHNTTHLHGPDLREAERKAASAAERIRRLFAGLPDGQGITPSKVHRLVGGDTLLTSTRRAISDLTSEGYLVRTDELVPGPQGKPEHLWVKAPADGQIGMFQRAA